MGLVDADVITPDTKASTLCGHIFAAPVTSQMGFLVSFLSFPFDTENTENPVILIDIRIAPSDGVKPVLVSSVA